MMFDVPFDKVGRIVVRITVAAKLLASRARRRVRGAAAVPDADLSRQREVVDAFLAASRAGDFDALVALLDPDVVLRADLGPTTGGSLAAGARGRRGFRKGLMFARLATSTRPALVNGAVGAVSSQDGRLTAVLRFIVAHQKIAAIDILADPSGWATSPDTPYR
jgi:RNA polymerase sigma-70 factor (ECF subfamily)